MKKLFGDVRLTLLERQCSAGRVNLQPERKLMNNEQALLEEPDILVLFGYRGLALTKESW
jgi:hypothetical protein